MVCEWVREIKGKGIDRDTRRQTDRQRERHARTQILITEGIDELETVTLAYQERQIEKGLQYRE